MTWVYGLPLWTAATVFIGGIAALSGVGLLLTRMLYPKAAELTHNDVAGPIMTTIGTVLAVLLTFMVVTMWQEYDNSAQGAATEAGELADLYHESFVLPDNTGAPLRRDVLQYLRVVVADEWPLMRRGESSPTANLLAHRIINRVERFDPTTMGAQAAAADSLSHAHHFLDARRARLFNNQQSVPDLIWSMMFLVSALTIASSYFFGVSNFRAHMLMTFALGAVVGATFLMIAELDLPFRGPLQIPSSAFSEQLQKLPALDGRI
jgi:hypothetical protein